MIRSERSRHAVACLVASLCLGALASAQTTPEEPSPIAQQSDADRARGERLFEAHCARCHGMGGTGGEGPAFAKPTLRRVGDDASLFVVIQEGIEGTDMPGNWMLSGHEIWLVAGYVRSLGRVEEETPPGDPERGREVFEGKGGCYVCHIVRGEGGSVGPDLTVVGATRGAAYLRQSLVEPGAKVAPDYLVVHAVTSDGQSLEGARVNEDSFTIQLRDASGRFHSFEKRKLRALEKRFEASLMPSYARELSPGEIQALVAYLASLRGEP